MSRRRPTRTTLRGWTRGLPPLAACFGVMFLFAWLEGQRLDNEYRAQDLTEEILEVKAKIEKLREQGYHLNRLKRMEKEAPDLFLREADPGQIVIIRGELRVETPASTNSHYAERRPGPSRRSVVLRLGAADGGSVVMRLQLEVARMDLDQGPPG